MLQQDVRVILKEAMYDVCPLRVTASCTRKQRICSNAGHKSLALNKASRLKYGQCRARVLRATVGGFDNRSWLVIVVSVAFVSERENVGLISRLSHGRIGESVCFPRSAVKLRKLVEGIENGRLFCGNSTRRRSLLRCWVNKLPAF